MRITRPVFSGILACTLLVALVATAAGSDCPTQASGFAGGTGSASDPYLVCTPAQLQEVGNNLGVGLHFLQVADIDLTGVTWTPIGHTTFGGPPQFNGHYDGAGYKISHLTINQPTGPVLGLFGKTTELSILERITLERVDILGSLCVSGLAAENSGIIRDCSVEGSISGVQYVGGMVGDNRANMTNCYADVETSGGTSVGGLIGVHFGILASPARVVNCYASGAVSGFSPIGGLVGADLIGTAIVANSFWDVQATGQATSVGGTGLTTAQMHMQSSFDPPWNFTSIWSIDEGNDYPRLRMTNAEPGTPTCFGVGCPCGNDDPTAGCANSSGSGGLLTGTGSTSVLKDDLVLLASQLPPNNNGLFYMGDELVQNAFFDGFQCALGNTFRFLDDIQNSGSSGTMTLGAGIVARSAGLITPGTTWHFHAWHRDVSMPSPCGTGANLTHIYSVGYTP